ncbi:hypothetical protein, partial [Acetivibrio cellulolyticus]|uniref:hypothetical protein n=1 Tax=Acetivibrio cellulolyticus TaxID=35830 RepID=UPI0002481BCC
MKLQNIEVELKDILLDPNNPRLVEFEGYEQVEENEFYLNTVQERTLKIMLQNFDINIIQNSIINNGFINVDQIVVKAVEFDVGTKYIVIEGNRRIAACKTIITESEKGRSISDIIIEQIKRLPVIELIEEDGDTEVENMIKGLRHISGPKEWGAYQKAAVIVSARV